MMRIRINIDGFLMIQITTWIDRALIQLDALMRHFEDANRVNCNPYLIERCHHESLLPYGLWFSAGAAVSDGWRGKSQLLRVFSECLGQLSLVR